MNNKNKLAQENDGAVSLLQALTNRAYRFLARREYSAQEIRRKLCDMAPAEIIEQMLVRLKNEGAQSDRRFAEMLCRSRFNNGKGPIRLLHELNQHQIDPDLIESTMAEYEDKWAELAKNVQKQKFGDAPPDNFKEWARQARFLQQRGFSPSHFDSFENK